MFEKQVENAAPSKAVRGWGGELAQKGWWHSFELPDGRVIEGVSTLAALKLRLAQFPIPEDLSGKRVLDIGAWDGWFSFEMERRGAEVTSIDCWDNERFRYIHRALGSKIDYRVLDFYELLPAKIGTFDIVLFQGVLYHLKHPLLALERVCALTKELAAVESFVITGSKGNPVPKHPVMEFYETDEFGGQFDNLGRPQRGMSDGNVPRGGVCPRRIAELAAKRSLCRMLSPLGAEGVKNSARGAEADRGAAPYELRREFLFKP